MCDDPAIEDMLRYSQRATLSRRSFGALSVGTGVTMMLPTANAADVSEQEVEITTPDGSADAYFAHPSKGKHPAVLIWPDAFGLRPAFREMGRRLAAEGYAVLIPNQFYRSKKAPVVPPGARFEDPNIRKAIGELAVKLSPATNNVDAQAFIAYLDQQDAVDTKRKMATTGYCMGGPMTMRTAALFPDRVGAAASFHGGGLVTDKPDSPHLLIPKMRASYLIAIAVNDDERQPEAKTALREAFDAAKLPAEIEVYADTLHGWCPPDASVYNEAQAEKAWSRMLALFKSALV